MAETAVSRPCAEAGSRDNPPMRRRGPRAGGVAARSADRAEIARTILALSALSIGGAGLLSLGIWMLLAGAPPRALALSVAASGAAACALLTTPLIIYSQLTARRLAAARDALARMTRHLAIAREETDRANRAKSAFLGNMSHELRTPLNAIIGFSEIMRTPSAGPLDEQRYRAYASDINESGKHLLGIVNDILALSKTESRSAPFEADGIIDVMAMLRHVSRLMSPAARRKEIELETVDDGIRNSRLMGNERLLRQVVLNLVSNAIKFTDAGGHVTMTTRLDTDRGLSISIADTGAGMSETDLGVAFMPFGQIGKTASPEDAGTGLGLPLAKAMVELHGGRLSIESARRRGTTVTVHFPAGRTVTIS